MTPGSTPRLAPTDERRSLGYLGMLVFLGSWAMMFAALFFVYAGLRSRAAVWPEAGSLERPLLLPGLSTVILIVSSLTLQLGIKRLRADNASDFGRWLLATIAVGLIFLGLQVTVWQDLWSIGLLPSSGAYGSVFYLLTVFHFLHVVVGLGLLVWRVPAALRGQAGAPARVPITLIAMFWHFVTIVWVAIYASVYVL